MYTVNEYVTKSETSLEIAYTYSVDTFQIDWRKSVIHLYGMYGEKLINFLRAKVNGSLITITREKTEEEALLEEE